MVRVDDNTLVRDNGTMVCDNDTLDGQSSMVLDGTMSGSGTASSMIELQSEVGTMLINDGDDEDTMKCEFRGMTGGGVGVRRC